ncbi:TIGR03545 family protein [bacterium]|nr:TIGR03545 family protein [bacterium]
MRWKGLIPVVVLIAIFTVISIFFIDSWIESGMEKAGEAIVGAKVEIDGLDFQISNLSIGWRRLQVTDPDHTLKNLIETGRTAFRMNPGALLRKRIVIEEMALEDVRTGTDRATDGFIPKKVKKSKAKSKPGVFDKARDKMAAEVQNLPVMQFRPEAWKRQLNLDSLVVLSELTMPARLDSAKADIVSTAADWESFYQGFHPDDDLEKIRNDFKDLDPKKIKSIPELTETLGRVQTAHQMLKSIQDTVKTRHRQIDSDFASIVQYRKQVGVWYRSDYQNILKKAKLPDLSVENIGMMLFGKTLVLRIERSLDLVRKVRAMIPKKQDKPKKEKPKRMKGQDIHFPDRYYSPVFLVRKMLLSGQTGSTEAQPGLQLSGEALNINSQPWILGKPTEIRLKGKDETNRSADIQAVLDHTGESFHDDFEIVLKSVSLNNMEIAQTAYLPAKIERGLADIRLTAKFTDDDFDLEMDVISRQLTFDFASMKTDNRFVDIVRDVMNEMKVVTLNTRVSHVSGDTKWSVKSNLDTQVSSRLKKMGSKALADAQEKIRQRLNGIRDERLNQVNQLVDEKETQIVGKIEYYEEKVEEQRLMIEAKIEAIKEDIESRKKSEESKLKKKAKGLLNNVLD